MNVYVITIRDPDWSNEYRVFGSPEPIIIDIDAGRSDLRDPHEFAEWKESHLFTARELELVGTEEAREAGEYIRSLVADYEEAFHG